MIYTSYSYHYNGELISLQDYTLYFQVCKYETDAYASIHALALTYHPIILHRSQTDLIPYAVKPKVLSWNRSQS